MTQILHETFLDYSDILIKPKMGNNLSSRKLVELNRTFKFKHGQTRTGIPVMSANMATTGNFGTAKTMLKAGMFPTLHKFYSEEDLIKFYEECKSEDISTDNLFISMGLRNSEEEISKLMKVYSKTGAKQNICIDAPNFYIPKALEVLKTVRETFPDSVIICGNIASSDICHKLLDYADIAKTGIGSGCFVGDMEVVTGNGTKAIKDIEIGDLVLTHTGNYQKVINKMVHTNHEEKILINDIECTPNHEFYVCKKEDISKIDEENYQDYCFWVSAENLDSEIHCLLKID